MTLRAQSLSCLRAHRPLFKHLSFEVNPGKVLLVEGKNGAGKTSLLRIISGLRLADHGEVFWQKQPIEHPECHFKSQLSWLGHQNPLKDEQTALENLQMLTSLVPKKNTSLEQALTRMGLAKFKHKPVKNFSAGMKRRLALAKLLISDTPLWILDEPQTSLDQAGIALFEKMAHEHLEANGLIVMTSHHKVGIDVQYLQPLYLGSQ